MVDAGAAGALWRAVRALPMFRRLLAVRMVSQFADGLFQAGLAGGLLFNPERGVTPWAIAGSFAVLFLPYSLLGPFAGALLDRWDRRWVLVWANAGRLLLVVVVAVLFVVGAPDIPLLCGALLANGFARFVASGLSAALPDVVPRAEVVTMNAVATAAGSVAAFLGANFMLLVRTVFGANDLGSAVVVGLVAVPVLTALVLATRFPPGTLGPADTHRAIHGSVFYAVSTGWLHGVRSVAARPTVTATLAALAAHRMVFGINTLLVLVLVRHGAAPGSTGLGPTALFGGATAAGMFLGTVCTPLVVNRWGRYVTAIGALGAAAVVQLAGAGLVLPMLVGCGFLLGVAGQVIKLCADSAIQLDVDDAQRGQVFAVQDSLFWVAFIAAVTLAAALIPADGYSPALAAAGSIIYLAGLAAHTIAVRAPRHSE